MDTSPEIKAHHLPSLLLSSAGWIVTVGVAVWFFVFAKPNAYESGYQAGAQEQNEIDRAIYEEQFGSPLDATPDESIVNVRVISAKASAFSVEQISFGTANPFETAPAAQTLVYDANTAVVRRVVLAPQEFDNRRRQAQERGENPVLVPPFDDIPASAADIKPGDRLEVLLRQPGSAEGSSFVAASIAIVIEPVLP